MSSQWHYFQDGKQFGPVTSGDLKTLAASGILTPSDAVQRSGMAHPIPASAIRGLFPDVPPVIVLHPEPPQEKSSKPGDLAQAKSGEDDRYRFFL